METPNVDGMPEAITLSLDENERYAIARLTQEMRLTPEQLLRIALATYEAVDDYRRAHRDERMPWERRKWGEPFGAGLAE